MSWCTGLPTALVRQLAILPQRQLVHTGERVSRLGRARFFSHRRRVPSHGGFSKLARGDQLGRHEFGRVGHSHLQGALKRQAD